MPAPRISPARNATRISSSPPTRTTRRSACSGKYAQDAGLKKVFLIAPNYQAGTRRARRLQELLQGRDRRRGLSCRSASSTIRPSCRRSPPPSPTRSIVFLPGGMGVNFVKQFRQAGLADKIVFLSVLHGRRVDAAGAAGRRARLLRRRQLGAQPRHAAEQEVRRRLREGIRRGAGDLRLPGLRRRAPDRRRAQADQGQRPPTRTRCGRR